MPFLPQPSPFIRAWDRHQEKQECASDGWVVQSSIVLSDIVIKKKLETLKLQTAEYKLVMSRIQNIVSAARKYFLFVTPHCTAPQNCYQKLTPHRAATKIIYLNKKFLDIFFFKKGVRSSNTHCCCHQSKPFIRYFRYSNSIATGIILLYYWKTL